MAGSPLQKKLRLLEGQKALLLNAPEGYLDELGPPPQDTVISNVPEANQDFVQLFVKNKMELDRWIETALGSIRYDGILWICYPKGSSKVDTDLNRDIIWELLSGRDIRPVAMVSIDSVWSGMRYRPTAVVKA